MSIGVRFDREKAMVSRLDFELVEVTLLKPWDEDLPQSRSAARPHRMAAAVPMVEVADDAESLGIRSPHRKTDAPNTRMLDHARAELLIEPEVGAFTEEMQIKICKDGRIAVGILNFAGLLPAAVRSGQGDGQAVKKEIGLIVDDGLEETVMMHTVHGIQLVTADDGDPQSLGLERANDNCRPTIHGVRMNAQNVERCAVVGANDRRHFARVSSAGLELFQRSLRRGGTGSGF